MNSPSKFMWTLFLFICVFVVTRGAYENPCGASYTCKDRCNETKPAVGDSEGARLMRFGCRCDRLCFFYGDCCVDRDVLCPKNGDKWQVLKYKLRRKYLQCEELVVNDSRMTLMVINKCPKRGTTARYGYFRALCESKPNFFHLTSFVPVSDPDGHVYRNTYCAKCLPPEKGPVLPWEISYVRCSSAFRLVYENGFVDLKGGQDLLFHVLTIVKGWLSEHCHPILKPQKSSNIHHCDPKMRQRSLSNSSCDGGYEPIWVQGADGSPMLFPNRRCAAINGHENVTKHCLSDAPEAAANYLFSSYDYVQRSANPHQAYYPGSLTILLNFGPDGKMELNMVEKDMMKRIRGCPNGTVLERATNVCKRLICPTGTILLSDGTCKTIQEITRYETHLTGNLSVRYDTSVFPEMFLPATEDFIKVNFEKYFNLDDGGMLNFSINARTVNISRKGESNSSVASVTSFFDIFVDLILKDESQEDMRVVQKMFDDFNKRLASVVRNSESFKLMNMNMNIFHKPIRKEAGKHIDWCPNGDIRFYDSNTTFKYWQEERLQKDGNKKNDTFVTTFDTDTIYKTGEFDLQILLETDLSTNEEVVKQNVRVCQRHPWIESRGCTTEVMLNRNEYRILKNRSVEVLADHQIYGINEYEVCHKVKKLVPYGRKKSLDFDPRTRVDAHRESTPSFDKVLVCLRPLKRRETMFITFSALQGTMTLILLPISLIFLLATISIYVFFKKLRNLPGLILLHLTISLLLSHSLIFLILNYDFGISWSCTLVAVANHYLLLMSFCWTNTYAYVIFRTFTTFKNLSALRDFSVTKKMRKYCAYSYGMPCLLIATCMIIDGTTGWVHYGGDNLVFMISDEPDGRNATIYGSACWINNPTASIAFFGVPALIMVIVNGILYVITVKHVKEGSKKMETGRRVSSVSSNTDSPVDLKTFMRLSSVMGFTWILGYSSAFIKSIAVSSFGSTLVEVIAFFFIVSTALQGVGIFVAFTTGKRVKALLAEKMAGTGLEWAARRFSKDSISTVSTATSTACSTPEVKDRKLFE